MGDDLLCAVAGSSVSFHHVGPEDACGAELCDFHKVVGADAEGEPHPAADLVDLDAALLEGVDIVASDCEGEAEFLDDACAGVVEVISLDVDDADLGILSDSLDALCEDVVSLVLAELAAGGEHVERAHVERRAHILGLHALLCHILDEVADGLEGDFRANLAEVDLYCGEEDVLEKDFIVGNGEGLALVDAESYGLDTLLEAVQCLLVSLCGTDLAEAVVLAGEPFVGVHGTPDEGELSRHGAEEFDVLKVLGAVIRAYRKTFVRLPYELLVVVGALKVLDDYLIPLLGGDRRELSKKFVSHS